MQRRQNQALIWTLLAAIAAPAGAIHALELSWYTCDAGGGRSAGGAFVVHGTIGQADAGLPATGGAYVLTGGFWAGIAQTDGVLGDCDADGDVDLADYVCFANCLNGPDSSPPANCDAFAMDSDEDVDLFDFAEFQVLFGPQ
jgi:hypothetical protein